MHSQPGPWRKKASGQWTREGMVLYAHASPDYRARFYACAECGGHLAPLRREYRFGCRSCGLIFGTGWGKLWGYEKGHQKAETAAAGDFLSGLHKEQLGNAPVKYVLDTSVFNRVVEGTFDLSALPNACGFVATHVQVHELEAAPEPKRTALLQTFKKVAPAMAQAAFSFDTPGAGFDEGEWSSDPRIAGIAAQMKPHPNNWKDALIANVAQKHGYALATADEQLASAARASGVEVFFVRVKI